MTRALNSISNFLFEENCIRATVDGDTPWFVAKDIASALGIEWRGSDWLAAEVLPAIRKTGSYIAKKPIHVRKHDRRTSTKIDDAIKLKRNIDRLETVADTIAPKPQNACAMIIDGEPVWVDINKYHGAGRAVVIEHDGRIRIQDVEPEVINFKPFGARTALGQRFKSPFGGTARNSVAVIGMVIGAERPAIQDTAPVQIEHEPVKKIALEPQYRGKRIKFRDKILQLIDETNLSNRQIAQVTGATYQTVTHWRRWRDDRVSA
ncbi:hypothetical protein [Brucella intermedia]|uniref:hypothetical protein n=1 Tax=Brucella intermedia TaxID=94625 RepID=UPI001592AEEE|nr:hypothetical protein [Brucella intermedia]